VPLNPGDHLPDADHVLRYIGKRHVDGDVINGSGFLATPRDDTPSLNWMEYYAPPREAQLGNITGCRRIKYERRGKLALLHILGTKAYLAANSQLQIDLAFIYDPLVPENDFPPDPSHSIVQGLPTIGTPEGEAFADLLTNCIVESFAVTPD
jgi:hypothetical protein